MKQIVTILLLCLAPIFASAHETAKSGILIDHPWMRATSPTAPMTAGYLKITNGGMADDRLVGASADFAQKVEIHETIKEGDVSKMRALADGLDIVEEAEFIFQPGGLHLMFRGLQHQMVVGETHHVELQFEKAGVIMVEFLVEAAGKRGHDHSGNMKMGSGSH